MSGRTWDWIEENVVYVLHADALATTGGIGGILNSGNVSSAIARPQNAVAYRSPIPDIADLAAEYLFGLATNHGFVDGNKRTAWMIAVTFLDQNGATLIYVKSDAESMVLDVANGHRTVAQIAAWFRARITIIP